MKRERYLIAYDIREPGRLRAVAKIMTGFGLRMQYSVFVCDLTAAERLQLFTDLLDVIDTRTDCIASVRLGDPRDRDLFTFFGPQPRMDPAGPVIV